MKQHKRNSKVKIIHSIFNILRLLRLIRRTFTKSQLLIDTYTKSHLTIVVLLRLLFRLCFFFHTDLIQFNHYDLLSWLARKRSNPLSSDAQNTMLNNEHLTVKIAGGDAMNFRMTNITSVPNALWISNKSEDRERCSTIIPILSYWNENEWDYYNN